MSGSISTVAIHADRDVHPSRAVAPPIYQTATFWAEDAEQFAQAAVNRRGQGFYTRYGNPNHAQVAAVVAELEHTEAAMVTASGMAALTTAVLALVSAGDHVIGQRSTYGGTASVLLNLLPRLGVSTTQVDQADPEAFENALNPQTRLILVESPSNPLLQITHLRAVADLARAHNVLTIADNTFATPVNQRPADDHVAFACVYAGRCVLHDPLSRQSGCRHPRCHGPNRRADAAPGALDEFVRDHVRFASHRSGGGLPAADLHPWR